VADADRPAGGDVGDELEPDGVGERLEDVEGEVAWFVNDARLGDLGGGPHAPGGGHRVGSLTLPRGLPHPSSSWSPTSQISTLTIPFAEYRLALSIVLERKGGRSVSATTEPEAADGGGQLSRRDVLKAGVAGAATAAVVASGVAEAASASAYPRLRVVELAKLKRNSPVAFSYPLSGQPNVLLDLGRAVPAGVGPRASIVAYSILCQHMGCPVEYDRKLREFDCPCHQSRYDPERLGSIIQGVAMQPLPRVLLQVRNGSVWAVGVDGRVYGSRNNLHPGNRVGGEK
jgi:arsenite oxidase small subunit